MEEGTEGTGNIRESFSEEMMCLKWDLTQEQVVKLGEGKGNAGGQGRGKQ